MQPGFLPLNATGVSNVTGILKNGQVNNTSAWCIASDKVHEITTLAGTPSVDAGHVINHAHANETGWDSAMYYTNGTKYFFYSFSDDTDWDVGRTDMAGTFDDDFMSTVPANPLAAPYLTGGKNPNPHPMVVGDDGILYIGDRNFVHAYDGTSDGGTNGTFIANILQLPDGYIIRSFATTSDYKLVIYASQTTTVATGVFALGNATAYFWDYLSLNPVYSRDLQDNYIGEGFNWNGTVACFTSDRVSITQPGRYKLQIFNGSNFEVVQTYTTGNVPERGGVQVVSKDIYWNGGGILYAYSNLPDVGGYGLHYLTTSLTDGTSGMCKQFSNFVGSRRFQLLVSSGITTSGGLQRMNANYIDTGYISGLMAVPDFDDRKIGKVTAVEITFKNSFSGGRGVRVTIQNYSAGSQGNYVVFEDSVSSNSKVRVEQDTSGNELGNARFTAINPIIEWITGSASTSAPGIVRIDILYDIIDIKI